jgi:type IV pilus assembly protein PilB
MRGGLGGVFWLKTPLSLTKAPFFADLQETRGTLPASPTALTQNTSRMNMTTSSMGDNVLEMILLEREVLTMDELESAQLKADEAGVRLERYLVEEDLISGTDMALALSEYLNMPPIDLSHFTPSLDLIELVTRETMMRHMVVPIARVGDLLTIALGDPFDVMAVEEVQGRTGLHVTAVVAPENQVNEMAQRIGREPSHGLEDVLKAVSDSDDVEVDIGGDEELSLDELLESADDGPVIRIVNTVMVEALRKGASDIHIEPEEKTLRLRYRVDGMLYENPTPPKQFQSAMISRIKIMSNLDIAERRIPQDGRFKIRAQGKEVDVRVSTLPTVHGEKVVMRILDRTSLAPSLDALGLDALALENMRKAIAQPHGIILVTGPTGSGKTTTLYSALQEINDPGVNIITVEDPVEYQLQGVNQVQTHADVGLTFASGLRSILRQDPDIVMVGEIRDGETAAIAVQAALTGHLVLSTLHTNDAAGAVARLLNMGVEPFLLASSVLMTQAQRLYRKLCPHCRKKREVPTETLRVNQIDPDQFDGVKLYEAAGCSKCNEIGYKGRGALMEIMMIDDAIRAQVLGETTATAIREIAVGNGMKPLRDVGLEKVHAGETSIEEILRITALD